MSPIFLKIIADGSVTVFFAIGTHRFVKINRLFDHVCRRQPNDACILLQYTFLNGMKQHDVHVSIFMYN